MDLKCVIIDDEPLAIKVIKNYVDQTKGLIFLASFSDATESLDYLRSQEIDLLFLDINMASFRWVESIEKHASKTTYHNHYCP